MAFFALSFLGCPLLSAPLFIYTLLSFPMYLLFSSNTYMLFSFTKYVLIFCSIVFIPLPSMLFRYIGSSPVYRDSRVSDLRTAFNNPSGPGGTARKRALMAAGAQGNNSNRDRGDNTQTTSSSRGTYVPIMISCYTISVSSSSSIVSFSLFFRRLFSLLSPPFFPLFMSLSSSRVYLFFFFSFPFLNDFSLLLLPFLIFFRPFFSLFLQLSSHFLTPVLTF